MQRRAGDKVPRFAVGIHMADARRSVGLIVGSCHRGYIYIYRSIYLYIPKPLTLNPYKPYIQKGCSENYGPPFGSIDSITAPWDPPLGNFAYNYIHAVQDGLIDCP